MKDIPVRKIATAQKIEVPQGRFSIRAISDVLKGKDIIHDLHRHDFYFILAVDHGSGIHEIDFTQFKVGDNSVFILRPGQVHQLELKNHSTGFLIEFDATFYKPNDNTTVERLKKATRKNACNVEAEKFTTMFGSLSSIFREFNDRHEGYIEVIKANLDVFLIEYIRQSQNSKPKEKTANTYSQERFEELTELLESRISELKTVSQYADILSLSPYQLNAITKTIIGKTVSDLINDQILLEAKRYLLATSNQVKDIAYHLGYEDVSYFIRFFKKHINLSPEAFRQKFK
jgi:AraC family transcriptional regulator, transcriptional activator of pobA